MNSDRMRQDQVRSISEESGSKVLQPMGGLPKDRRIAEDGPPVVATKSVSVHPKQNLVQSVHPKQNMSQPQYNFSQNHIAEPSVCRCLQMMKEGVEMATRWTARSPRSPEPRSRPRPPRGMESRNHVAFNFYREGRLG